MIFATPGTFSKSDATHQKQPPARLRPLNWSVLLSLDSSPLVFCLCPDTRSARISRKNYNKDFLRNSLSRFTQRPDSVRGIRLLTVAIANPKHCAFNSSVIE